MGKQAKEVCALGLFNPDYVGKLDLYELTFLKNFILWFSSYEKMTKKDFKFNTIGGWVSNVKAKEWGMTERKLSSTIKKLNRPLIPGDLSSQILITVPVPHNKRASRKGAKDSYSGSRRFVILNPAMIKKLICWAAISDESIDSLHYFIKSDLCNRASMKIGLGNFLQLLAAKNKYVDQISTKIKTKLSEKPKKNIEPEPEDDFDDDEIFVDINSFPKKQYTERELRIMEEQENAEREY
jgi:hypothetical protein